MALSEFTDLFVSSDETAFFSGVHLDKNVTITLGPEDNAGNAILSREDFLRNPYVTKFNVDILNKDGTTAYANFLENYQSPTITFTESDNIKVFNNYEKDFKIRVSMVDRSSNEHVSLLSFSGNLLEVSGVEVQDHSGTYSYDSASSWAKTNVNSTSKTGGLSVTFDFQNDPTYTKYDHLEVFISSSSDDYDPALNTKAVFSRDLLNATSQSFEIPESAFPNEEPFYIHVKPFSAIGAGTVQTLGPHIVKHQPLVTGRYLTTDDDIGGNQNLDEVLNVGNSSTTGFVVGSSEITGDLTIGGNITTNSTTTIGTCGEVLKLKGSTVQLQECGDGSSETPTTLFEINESSEAKFYTEGQFTEGVYVSPGKEIDLGRRASIYTRNVEGESSMVFSANKFIFAVSGQSPSCDEYVDSNEVGSYASAILLGTQNKIFGDYDGIVAGTQNIISGSGSNSADFNFIGAGSGLQITGSNYASIVGGLNNKIIDSSHNSFIGGGTGNILEGSTNSVIGGGINNHITSAESVQIFGSYITDNSAYNGYIYLSDNNNRTKSPDASDTLFIDFEGGVDIKTGDLTVVNDVSISGDITSVDSIQFDTGAGTTVGQAQLAWNSEDLTLDLGLDSNVTLQVGQEQLIRVKCVDPSGVYDGMAVYAAGTIGASSNIEIERFTASYTGVDELYFIGIATEDMAENAVGFVTTFGKVREVDGRAFGTGQGVKDPADTGDWALGDILWVSPNQAGTLTTIKPSAPNRRMAVAMVLAAPNQQNITLMVRAEHGYHLDEIHDIRYNTQADRDLLLWNASDEVWENGTLTSGDITTALGFTPSSTDDQTLNEVLTQGNVSASGITVGSSTISGDLDVSGALTVTNDDTGVSDIFSVDGVNGRLFGVTDEVTGTVFSVNDAAGLPIVEVESTADYDKITIGEYGSDALVISGTNSAIFNVDVDITGGLDVTGDITMGGETVLTGITSGDITGALGYTPLSSETDDQTLDEVLAQGNTSTRDISVGAITGSALNITGSVSITGTTTIDNVLVLERSETSYGAGLRFSEAGTKNWELKQDQDGGNNDTLILADGSDSPVVAFEQGGNVGIGTTSPAQKLEVVGNILLNTIGNELRFTNNNVGAYRGSNNKLVIAGYGGIDFNASATSGMKNQSTRMVITDSGEVGIGTTSPSYPLHVSVSGDNGVRIDSDNHASLYINSASSSSQYIRFFENNSNKYWIQSSSGVLRFRPAGTSTAANQVIFDSTGSVGIGSGSPSTKLHVVDNTSSLKFTDDLGDNFKGLELSGSNPTVKFDGGGNTWNLAGLDGAFALWDKTNSNYRLWINNSGNVGIGTTSPAAKLDVYGGHIRRSTDANNYAQLAAGGSGGFIHGYGGGSEKFIIRAYASSGVQAFFTAGNIGIGTTTPSNVLHVKSTTLNNGAAVKIENTRDGGSDHGLEVVANGTTDSFAARIKQQGAGDILQVFDGNDEVFTILDGGNVGIGDPTPSYRLDVSGTGRFVGDLYVDADLDVTGDITMAGNTVLTGITSGDITGALGYTPLSSETDDQTLDEVLAQGNTSSQEITVGGATINGDIDVTGDATITGSLDIVTPAAASARESIFNASVSDSTYSSFGIGNFTNSDNIFIPLFYGFNNDDDRAGLAFLGLVDQDVATSDVGAIDFNVGNIANNSSDPLNASRTALSNHNILSIRNNASQKFTIDAAGNVGIGVTSPSNKLEVNGNIAVKTASGNSGIKIITDNSSEAFLIMGDPDDNSMGGLAYNNSTNTLSIDCNNQERMTILSDGKVGVGNTAPLQKLSVNGIINSDTNQDYYGAWMSGNSASGEDSYFAVGPWYNTAGYFKFIRSGTPNRLSIYSYNTAHHVTLQEAGGNVGIGIASPAQKLEVFEGYIRVGDASNTGYGIEFERNSSIVGLINTANGRINIQSSNSGDVELRDTAGTGNLILKNGGNVGIGTTSPNNFGFLERALQISAGSASSTTLQQAGLIISASSDADDADDFGYLSFTNYQATVSNGRVAEIRILKNGTNVDTGEFTFHTSSGSGPAERMRIDYLGNVGIGNSNPTTAKLVIRKDDGYALRTENASGWTFRVAGATGNTEVGGTISVEGAVTLNTVVASSESDALFINGSNVVVKRTLGTNAFTSTAYAPIANPTFTGTVTAPNLTLTNIASSSETNALFINASNGVFKRTLGSAAFSATTDFAAASHTHSYLPLSGGTLTGDVIFDDGSGDSPALKFRDGSDINFSIYHSSSNTLLITREGNSGADFAIHANATDYTNSYISIGGSQVTPTLISNWSTAYTYSQVGHLPLAGGTMSGNLTIASTDPTITLFDNSGANTDPNGTIIFSELSGTNNFDINYNGASDRLEFRGLVSSVFTDLVYIKRNSTDTVQVFGNVTASSFIKSGGSSTEFLKADGSVDSSSYITASSIDTLTNKTWNGNVIASAYLDADTAHLSGTQTFTGAKIFEQSGTNALALKISDGTSFLQFVPNLGSGGYTQMASAGDIGLIFSTDDSNSSEDTGKGLVIAPWSDGGGLKIDDAGNVGIGTTSPAVDLHVADDVRIDDQLYVRTISSQYFSSSNNLSLIYGGAANFTVSSNATERFRIDSSGDVGIGTTSPDTKLTIQQAADENGVKIIGFDDQSSENFQIFVRSSGHARMIGTNAVFLLSGDNYGGAVRSGASGGMDWDAFNQFTFSAESNARTPLSIQGAASQTGNLFNITSSGGTDGDLLTVLNNGRVGIGVIAPDSNLQVASTVKIGSSSESSYSLRLERQNATITQDAHFFCSSNNSPKALFIEGGYWTGEEAGTVTAANSGYAYYESYFGNGSSSTYKDFGFVESTGSFSSVDLASLMRFTSNGRIGIRTTSPATALEVNGAISATGVLNAFTTSGSTQIGFDGTSSFISANAGGGSNASLKFYSGSNALRMVIDSGGSVGINVASPAGDKLLVQGVDDYFAARFTGSATAGKSRGLRVRAGYNASDFPVLVEKGDGTDIFVIDGLGNVGIGTTGPSSKLHVYDTSTPSSGDYITSKIYSSGGAAANGYIRTGLDVETNRVGWYNADIIAGNFKVSNDQRIGNSHLTGVKSIATLEVDNAYSSVASSGSLTAFYGQVTTTFTSGESPVSNAFGLRLAAPSVAASTSINNYYGIYISGASTSGTITNKYAFATEAAAGNVGIGTTTPAKTLDVSANGSNQGIYLNISNVGRLHMYADGDRNYFAGVSGNGHRFTTTGGANVEILNNGDVGIGLTDPDEKLEVSGNIKLTNYTDDIQFGGTANMLSYNQWLASASGGMSIKNSATALTGHIAFETSSGEKVRISRDGKVGIGTTSAEYELHVIGTASFTDTVAGAYFEENASHPSLKKFETGTILVMNEEGQLVPCSKADDTMVFGVSKHGYKQPIVMGAEPIKVTGPIKVGDYITTSDIPGHGQKSTQPYPFGMVIAQAMENGDGESYHIKAMIRKM